MDETRDELVGGTREEELNETREELNETRVKLEPSQEDELERVLANDARDPTTLPVYDDGGKDPSPLPCFALAANAEGGMINGDAPALARGAGEGSSLDTYPAEGEGLTLLECVLGGAPRCLSVCVEDEGFLVAGDQLFLECC